MAKTLRTQAMRALDARKIPYQVYVFPDTIHDAVQVAASIEKSPDQVFKTLVLIREDASNARPLLVMVPANREIDVRLLARELGVKSVRMTEHDHAENLTGLKVGGISALALLNRPFDAYLDECALQYEQILVSGGQRGVDLELRVSDILAVTGARTIAA